MDVMQVDEVDATYHTDKKSEIVIIKLLIEWK